MNGILAATRAGVVPASALPARPARQGPSTIASTARGTDVVNRAIEEVSLRLRHAFEPARSPRQTLADSNACVRSVDAATAPSAGSCNEDANKAKQNCARAQQDPDIGSAHPVRRLSAIASTPSAAAIEEVAMSAVTVASNNRKPPAAITAAAGGTRWWNALARLWRGSPAAMAEAPEVRFAAPSLALSSLGFREFTTPRRLQGGGAPRDTKAGKRNALNRTVERHMHKAAGQVGAIDALRTARSRQR
jgi:hypothetical protein